MGKASRRKHLEEQKRTFFQINGDARGPEERAQARATLDELQKKLTDDALREDGFYFSDGKCVDDRRPRTSAGMVTRTFDGHSRSVKAVTIVQLADCETSMPHQIYLLTFGLDMIAIWDFQTGDRIAKLSVEHTQASFICGASSRAGPYRSKACFQLAWATHDQPMLHVFDASRSCMMPHSSDSLSHQNQSYMVGHQQQIAAMTFNTQGHLLATCSWDSTCVLWTVAAGNQGHGRLGLLQIFHVHENGAHCCAFSPDDRTLLTCGDCTVKLWDVSSFSQDSAQDESQIEQERRDWERAIPSCFSVDRSLELLAFDDTLTALVPNHDWIYSVFRNGLEHTQSHAVLIKQSSFSTDMKESESERHSDTVGQLVSIFSFEKQTSLSNNTVSHETNGLMDKLSHELSSLSENQTLDPITTLSESSDFKRATETTLDLEQDSDRFESILDQWGQTLHQMESFDFEQLLNPAASLLQSRSSISLRIDADSQLIREFSSKTTTGVISSHTSTITACAMAVECDLVVTVSLDKTIRYWSLHDGLVLETVHEAHKAPITCCCLSPPSSMVDGEIQEMLLGTGGKDNLVKIWRRQSPDPAECIYSLSGHYDAVTFCAFDPSGVFVVSSGNDTKIIMWRVHPSRPDPPEAPTLINADRFAITIDWQVPLANGSKLLTYIVRTACMPSIACDDVLEDALQAPVADLEIDAKVTTATVGNLRPGAQYTMQIAAVNAIGESDFSLPSEPMGTLAFTPSQIEKPVRFSDCEATQIQLVWSQPSANGAHIYAYTLRCLPENNVFVPVIELSIPVDDLKRIEPIATATTSPKHVKRKRVIKKEVKLPRGPIEYEYVVHGLWPGEVYQFSIAAENRRGVGRFSRPSDYVKMNSTAPDAPERPRIAEITQRHILVDWVKPKCNGSDILQYTLQWTQLFDTNESPLFNNADPLNTNQTTSSAIVLLTRSITGTRYTIHGLEPGKYVSVRVSASNLIANTICDSEFSFPSDKVRTLCDVPDEPAQPQIVDTSSHTITIGFKAPAANGLPILRYEVVMFSEEMEFGIASKRLEREFSILPSHLDAIEDDTDGSDKTYPLSFTIHKLRGKTFYSVGICAINALGSSSVSTSSQALSTAPAIVPAVILAAPVIEGNVEPTKARIKWETPVHDGGSRIAAFHLQYTSQSLRQYESQAEEEHELVLYSGGCELLATFLRPQTLYHFRIATSNAVGRSAFSARSLACITPNLVTHTIYTYFAHRPAIEHEKARVIQRRYRSWKRAVAERMRFHSGLAIALRGWHIF